MFAKRLFAFIAVVCTAWSLQAQQTVASLTEVFDGLKVGDSITVPPGAVVRQGNIELTLTGGVAAPVIAGDETIGYFYKGGGRYTYTITAKEELAVAAHNAKRAADVAFQEKDGSAVVSDEFARALFWTVGGPLPKIEGSAGGESLEAAFDEHTKEFGLDVSAPAAHQFVLQKMNAPKQRFFRAEFAGGRDETVYLYDEADRRMETLYTLQRGKGRITREMAFPTILSDHPIGGSLRKVPQPRFQLTAIDYALEGSGVDLKLKMTETFTGVRPGIHVLRLDQVDTMWDDDEREHHFRVRSAKDAKGYELSIHHRNGQLLVGLREPLAPNATATVTFEIEGDVLQRPGGDNFWQLGVWSWFPQPDLVEQYYTIRSVVKVKKPFVPFAPGKTVRRAEEGDFNVVENVIDKPVQFATVHAGKYQWEEETRDGLTIRVASYAGKNTRAMKQLTSLAFTIIDYYKFFLGPFPFPEFTIIEMNTWGYGQAPPATMFITKEAFNPTLGEVNQYFSKGINERFAHEIAHQYWGHVVKMPSAEEQWITESFADYSAAVFLRKFKGNAAYDTILRHWQQRAAEASKYASIPMANRIRMPGDGLSQSVARSSLIYDKGAYLLAILHKELGDQLFLSFLKSYQTNFRWKFGTSETVTDVLKFVTKKDHAAFMEDHFWGTKMPQMPK